MAELKVNRIPFEDIRAWFFDLDGTLMDTDDQVAERLARKLKVFPPRRAGIIARKIIMALETPLNGWITFIDMLGLDNFVFRLSHLAGIAKNRNFTLVPGADKAVEGLAEKFRLAVVSTRPQQDAQAFLDQYGMAGFFSLIIHRGSTRRLKPHPSPLLFAARQLAVKPEECVMVGDTTVDMFAAKKAGVWAIGVLCGWGTEKELQRAGADIILPSTGDIPELMNTSPSGECS
ncbi:MAG: HAD family hydrolase [Bacteroidales bacterium]|nr:HAD family hydrolase [Bacteroidales bacterium]